MNALNKIPPWRSEGLTDGDKKRLFDEANSLQADRYLMGRAALKAGLWVGGIGALIGVSGMVCAATLFPLKTRVVEYYTVNQNTGYVGPSVGAADAPTLYNAQVAESALQTYVELRENYLYETDVLAFHRVTLMSTPEEQVRYKAMHDDPKAPARALRDHGYIQIENFQFWPVGDGKARTHEYVVKFDRRVMPAGQPVPPEGRAVDRADRLSVSPGIPDGHA
jgi:type IV secretion system protein VirB8